MKGNRTWSMEQWRNRRSRGLSGREFRNGLRGHACEFMSGRHHIGRFCSWSRHLWWFCSGCRHLWWFCSGRRHLRRFWRPQECSVQPTCTKWRLPSQEALRLGEQSLWQPVLRPWGCQLPAPTSVVGPSHWQSVLAQASHLQELGCYSPPKNIPLGKFWWPAWREQTLAWPAWREQTLVWQA